MKVITHCPSRALKNPNLPFIDGGVQSLHKLLLDRIRLVRKWELKSCGFHVCMKLKGEDSIGHDPEAPVTRHIPSGHERARRKTAVLRFTIILHTKSENVK